MTNRDTDINETDAPAIAPRDSYDAPAGITSDDSLSRNEKLDLLKQWRMDLQARLRAEAEGMSSSNPISASLESELAEEERAVYKAIESLSGE